MHKVVIRCVEAKQLLSCRRQSDYKYLVIISCCPNCHVFVNLALIFYYSKRPATTFAKNKDTLKFSVVTKKNT